MVLLTNDGNRAHRLQHPRYEVPRVYEVDAKGVVSKHAIERLLAGVELEDGPARLLDAAVLGR
ncbi:MAG TPA: hypothetical protein VK864_19620, partial [Longimicrobiales bacterium]|nr:hypothetical protein [Longimicrobiales bacterium]